MHVLFDVMTQSWGVDPHAENDDEEAEEAPEDVSGHDNDGSGDPYASIEELPMGGDDIATEDRASSSMEVDGEALDPEDELAALDWQLHVLTKA